MNWTRYKLLIISGGICLIVSGGLIFWILSTKSKSAEVDGKIQSLNNRQASLMAKKPYPSQQNVEQLKAEQAKVIEQRDTLKTLIQEGQMEVTEVGRFSFADYARGELLPKLRKAAKESTKGGEQGVILKDPDFGLTAYLSGTIPEATEIIGLLLDVQTMEHLSLMLFDAGISELLVIKKEEAESANDRRGNRPGPGMDYSSFGADPMMNPMGGMGPNNRPGQPPADERSKLAKEKDRLFDWEDYRLEFRVYEDRLWETINKIISDPNQLVITDLSITNSNQKLWPKYLVPVLGQSRTGNKQPQPPKRAPRREMSEIERLLQGGGDPAENQVKEEEALPLPGLAERRQNVVGGDLLNVVMVVRVYRLTEETQETEEGL